MAAFYAWMPFLSWCNDINGGAKLSFYSFLLFTFRRSTFIFVPPAAERAPSLSKERSARPQMALRNVKWTLSIVLFTHSNRISVLRSAEFSFIITFARRKTSTFWKKHDAAHWLFIRRIGKISTQNRHLSALQYHICSASFEKNCLEMVGKS